MLKKIALGALLIGLVAVLIWGAVNRTNAVSGQALGEGGRHGRAEYATEETLAQGNGGRWSQELQGAVGSNGRGRWGQAGGGRQPQGGAGNDSTLRGVPQADAQPQEWVDLQGTVVSVADDLIEIRTASGEVIPFEGQPLRFAMRSGFQAQVGDVVTVSGFAENGEFKIGNVANLSNGTSVTLRDVTGRPGWAGRGGRG